LFATWVALLIVGFALLHGRSARPFMGPNGTGHFYYMYLSARHCSRLGYGDVSRSADRPHAGGWSSRGWALRFWAILISYLPVLYQAFSRREADDLAA